MIIINIRVLINRNKYTQLTVTDLHANDNQIIFIIKFRFDEKHFFEVFLNDFNKFLF